MKKILLLLMLAISVSVSAQFEIDFRDMKEYEFTQIGGVEVFVKNMELEELATTHDAIIHGDTITRYYYSYQEKDQVCPDGWHIMTVGEWNEIKKDPDFWDKLNLKHEGHYYRNRGINDTQRYGRKYDHWHLNGEEYTIAHMYQGWNGKYKKDITRTLVSAREWSVRCTRGIEPVIEEKPANLSFNGYTYKTVKIGDNVWTKGNFNQEYYSYTELDTLTIPKGWHIPTVEDVNDLSNALGGNSFFACYNAIDTSLLNISIEDSYLSHGMKMTTLRATTYLWYRGKTDYSMLRYTARGGKYRYYRFAAYSNNYRYNKFLVRLVKDK